MSVLKEVETPTHIKRWVLHMQVFDYTIEYNPGSGNIADSLSRLRYCQSQDEEKTRPLQKNMYGL